MAQIKNKKKYPLITPKDKDFLVATQESTGKTRSISVGDLSQHIIDKIPNAEGDIPIKDIKFKGESLPVIDKSVEIPSDLSDFNDKNGIIPDVSKFQTEEQVDNKIHDYSIKDVKTIADLRLLEGKEGQEVRLLGYYEVGDKPPLLYKWVSGIGEDDGGSVIVSTGGYWSALFADSVDVRDFGAKNDKTFDSSFFCQNAVDFLKKNNGGTLLFGKGDYLIEHLDFIGKSYSNINIIGNGTYIYQKLTERKINRPYPDPTYARYSSADGCFLFNSNVKSQEDDSMSIKNINISGLCFVTDIVKYGFDQLTHQIYAYGVSNFKIKDCVFIGFLADGVCVGRGINEDGITDAYNRDIYIDNCVFDGINKDNRNPISIYYSDGYSITRCYFKNSTRHGMIGAIDIESDSKKIKSRRGVIRECTFENIGGVSAITYFQTDLGYSNFTNLVVSNCTIMNCNCAFAVLGGNTFYDSYKTNTANVVFENNRIDNVSYFFDFRYASKVMIKNSEFNGSNSEINNVVNYGCNDVYFYRCGFRNVKNKNGLGFIQESKKVSFDTCYFTDFTRYFITITDERGLMFFKNNTFDGGVGNNYESVVLKNKLDVKKVDNYIFSEDNIFNNCKPLDYYIFHLNNTTIPNLNNILPKNILKGKSIINVINGVVPFEGDPLARCVCYKKNDNIIYQEVFPLNVYKNKKYTRYAIDQDTWSDFKEVDV